MHHEFLMPYVKFMSIVNKPLVFLHVFAAVYLKCFSTISYHSKVLSLSGPVYRSEIKLIVIKCKIN
jgi:hypothetical protein